MYSMTPPTINIHYNPSQVLSFCGPYALDTPGLPAVPGVYAILTKSPLKITYDVVYVGQTGNLAERGFPSGHHAYSRWIKIAAGKKLFIAYVPIQGLSDDTRCQLEAAIIKTYNPPANRTLTLFPTRRRQY